MEKPIICKTTFQKSVIDYDEAYALYYQLKLDIDWEDGIPSKKGFTRKAKAINYGDYPQIDLLIHQALVALECQNAYVINGIYLNCYENGNMWTPNHSHKGTHQLVISLGETRTLQVSDKDYVMDNGDAIVFGSAKHGVPKDPTKTGGRISIATFMTPVKI